MNESCHTAHERDQTNFEAIWVSKSVSFPDRSFEWRALSLLTWKLIWNFVDTHEIMVDMYGDSRENLLEILAAVNT